jgi:hypothetical protein
MECDWEKSGNRARFSFSYFGRLLRLLATLTHFSSHSLPSPSTSEGGWYGEEAEAASGRTLVMRTGPMKPIMMLGLLVLVLRNA